MKIPVLLLACSSCLAQSPAHNTRYRLPGTTGAKATTVGAKLSTTLDIMNDFGARPGLSSDSALCRENSLAINTAISAAIAAGNTTVLVPAGNFPTRSITVGTRGAQKDTSLKITGPGTLQSCGPETLLTVGNQWGFRIENVQLDCNGIGTIGLLDTTINGFADTDDSISNLQIRGCTQRGLALDGIQNSVINNIGLYGNVVPLSITNGAGSSHLTRIEVQGAPTTLKQIFLGPDSTLPAFPVSGNFPVNQMTFERIVVECNGHDSCTTAPGPVALDMDCLGCVFRDSFFGSGPPKTPGPQLIIHRGGEGHNQNVYENCYFDLTNADMKFIVDGAGGSIYGPNRINWGQVLFNRSCSQPAITSGGLIIVNGLATTTPNCMRFISTDAKPVYQHVQWFPIVLSGATNQVNPPADSLGSYYYDAQYGPKFWNGNGFKDALGQEPGQCRILNGAGSPNGVVMGNPCDMYRNTMGGANTTLWIKETGAGTKTGWIAK
jgi:hypothetical protein